MRRSPLISVVVVLSASSTAFAQQVISPYSEEAQVVVPVAPAPVAPVQVAPPPGMPPQPMAPPPVPPPIVVPPPPGYYQPQAPQPYYYYPQQHAMPQYAQPYLPRTFHEEMQPRYSLMVAGLVVLGASWSINAASGYIADEWRLAVPVLGPFMETSQIYTGSGYEANRMVVGLLVFDGLIETAGAVMFIAGALTHHKVRVYDQPRVSVVPTAGPSTAGLAAFGRF
jgi:hypothetical protein